MTQAIHTPHYPTGAKWALQEKQFCRSLLSKCVMVQR